MNRTVTVYTSSGAGWGCFKRELKVTDSNFVSETDTMVTVKETYADIWGGESEGNQEYHKTLEGFIKSEKEWYKKHIKELAERHRHTLKMASEL